MNEAPDAARLTDRVAALVEAAKKAGADAADAVAVRGRSTSVSVRLGKVESTEASEGDDVSLRVFVGKRVASVSATAASDPPDAGRARRRHGEGLARRSLSGPGRCRIAGEDGPRSRPFRPDRRVGRRIAGKARLPPRKRRWPFRASPIPAAAAPAPALAVWCLPPRTAFSAIMSARASGRSASVIAGEGTGMERDYEYSSRLHFADLDAPKRSAARPASARCAA